MNLLISYVFFLIYEYFIYIFFHNSLLILIYKRYFTEHIYFAITENLVHKEHPFVQFFGPYKQQAFDFTLINETELN